MLARMSVREPGRGILGKVSTGAIGRVSGSKSTPSTRLAPDWVYGCAIWFLAAAPAIGGALLAIVVGGLWAGPIGAGLGLVVGVLSYRYARRILAAARAYEAERSSRERS